MTLLRPFALALLVLLPHAGWAARGERTASAPPAAHTDGQAEAELIAVYRLIGEGRGRQALERAEALVRQHPNFQLAQLVMGDLLALRTRPLQRLGDVPDDATRGSNGTLAELREESELRLRALRERPPEGAVPSQFVDLAARSRHAIAVDASRARLYLFENTERGLRLIADYYVSVGKAGIEKKTEGDLRTPLGIYYVTANLDPKSLRDFYGSGALPINYPNPYDTRRGKTGSGIWLHGTPPQQFARAPLATDGCVAIANPDLRRILRTVEVRTTPVVIAESLDWVRPETQQATARAFGDTLAAWSRARASGDVDQLLGFYAHDFNSYGKNLTDWAAVLRREAAGARGRPLQLKDRSLLHWKDAAETMVVTFGEVPAGARTGPVKRQYWMKTGGQWKIFFEGAIG